MCADPGLVSFRRIVDIPFEACVAALESLRLQGHDSEQHASRPAARAGRARSRLGYMPGRGPPGPGAAAPAAAHAAGRRLLVLLAATQRARPHPLRARPGHCKLLPGRPPPAGLVDPLAPASSARSRRLTCPPGNRQIRLALGGALATYLSQPRCTSRSGELPSSVMATARRSASAPDPARRSAAAAADAAGPLRILFTR